MKRVFAAAAAALLCLTWFPLSADGAGTPGVSASCAILVDAESGRVLMEKNAHEERAIASITKLMTALVAVESTSDLDRAVTIQKEWTLAEGSSMYLREGEELTLRELLYGLLLVSGNDAAVALWYRDKAPRNPQYLQTLKRYQYVTQAMAQLALGDPQGAQVTLAPLEPYCQLCRRHIDGIGLNLLRAVAEYRQNSPDWKPRLAAALDAAWPAQPVSTSSSTSVSASRD